MTVCGVEEDMMRKKRKISSTKNTPPRRLHASSQIQSTRRRVLKEGSRGRGSILLRLPVSVSSLSHMFTNQFHDVSLSAREIDELQRVPGFVNLCEGRLVVFVQNSLLLVVLSCSFLPVY